MKRKLKFFNYFIFFILINSIFSLAHEENGFDIINIDELNVEYSEENCKKVIDILKNVVKEIYVYNDIFKNPPNKNYYGVVNLIEELEAIETSDRKYFDFYRDIKRVTAKTKDIHFSFQARNYTNNNILIDQIYACVPISLYVKGDSQENAEMYIKLYQDCFFTLTDNLTTFINGHTNIPIKEINGKSPFEYIQDFSTQYLDLKNKHGTFTLIIDYFNAFPIQFLPLTKEELTNIEFTFNDDESMILNYTLFIYPTNDEENNDIFTINKLNKKITENVNEIEWKYSTKNKVGFQCLIDETNQVNVFKQSSFILTDDYEEIVKKCTEEFYSNSFPIIGIENQNLGGSDYANALVQQFTQVKILQRHHESIKLTELTNKLVPKDNMFDIETCEKIKEFKNITDDYGNGIKHHRTQVFQELSPETLKNWKETRKKYYEKNHLKKPTEIIIFTDFLSYSATSFYIKGLQETGGAILVGYRGNPKLKDEPLDASLSPSGAVSISGTEMSETLKECGFSLQMITTYETFNYTYQKENPIPREFLINPVDERVNIFQAYDDSLYNDFIKEAKRIFQKYNVDKECNPDNDLLLFEPDNNECYTFENIPHAHGGYQCDKERKHWSNICKPYYCDIGYYFDTSKNICVEDICTERGGEEEEEEQEEEEKEKEKEKEKDNIGTFIDVSFLIFIIGTTILFS